MKNNYTKPMIYFEDFELSQSIAADCRLISGGYGQSVYDPETGWNIYAKSSCDKYYPNAGDQPCYDIPIVGWEIFSS